MKRLLFALTLLIIGGSLSAQVSNYDFTFNVKNLKDTVLLGKYYGNRMVYRDTAVVSSTGELRYKRKGRELDNGMYGLVIPDTAGNQYFNFIVNDEAKISINFDAKDPLQSAVVVKSEENKQYYDYLSFLRGLTDIAKPWRDILSNDQSADAEKVNARKELEKLGEQVKAKQTEIRNSGTFFGIVLGMKLEPEVPQNDDQTWRWQYYKRIYFDNFKLDDDRIVNTFDFHQRIENFFDKVVAQDPDSIIVELDILLAKCPEYSESFKYIVNYTAKKYETSKVICMDKVFVHLGLNYFAKGKISWFDEENTKKVVDRAKEMAPTVCGVVAPEVILPDTNMKWHNLYEVPSKYKVLIFWEHTCGHCKKELPKIVDVMKQFDPAFAKVFAVEIDDEMEGMKEYLREHDLSDFINVGDNTEIRQNTEYQMKGLTTFESLNFRINYDIFSTPKVYILDENNIIKAKQLGAEQIEQLLNHFKDQDKKH